MNKLLDPNLESLRSTLSSMFEVPVYQRPYKWEKEQIEELFDDFLDEFQREGIFFLGTIFLSHKKNIISNIAVYEVIDGQQRLTTLGLILLTLYASFYEDGISADDIDVKEIRNILWKEKDLETDRECRLITSGSLEKQTLEKIFNWCFDSPTKFVNKVKSEKKNNCGIFEKVFYQNIIAINDCIDKKIVKCEDGRLKGKSVTDKKKLIFRYLKESVCVITITLTNGINNDRKKLFEIFESINSKGRKLDEIDLIKSYIFQNIDISDYDTYLQKWGELIIKTNDNLESYLAIFINSKIKYYKSSITVKIFRSFSKNKLKEFYDTDTLSETLERFIDDMCSNVDCYAKLINDDQYLINAPKFKYYTDLMRYLNYDHPKALLFKAYCDFSYNLLNKNQLTAITKAATIFMLLFQTLQEKDSRETAGKFETIMQLVYDNKGSYYNLVINQFDKELQLAALTENSIRNMIRCHIGYSKKETKALIGAFEFHEEGDTAKGTKSQFLYDKMSYVLKHSEIQVDHIAVQRPDKDDTKYSYFCEKDKDGNEVLALKDNSDFANKTDINVGMLYDLFIARILNKSGNLQLMWASENQLKSNGVFTLPSYVDFTSYSDIEKRADDIAEKLVTWEYFKIK